MERCRPTVRCLLPVWTWEAFAARAYVVLVALMGLGFGWMLVRLLT